MSNTATLITCAIFAAWCAPFMLGALIAVAIDNRNKGRVR